MGRRIERERDGEKVDKYGKFLPCKQKIFERYDRMVGMNAFISGLSNKVCLLPSFD